MRKPRALASVAAIQSGSHRSTGDVPRAPAAARSFAIRLADARFPPAGVSTAIGINLPLRGKPRTLESDEHRAGLCTHRPLRDARKRHCPVVQLPSPAAYQAPGAGTNIFTGTLNVATAGTYQVYARWTASTNRATNAPYTIGHSGARRR